MELPNNNGAARLSEPQDKSLTSQVLEYYQKYSLDRELPKYFSGTSSSFKIGNWHVPPSTSRAAKLVSIADDSLRDHATNTEAGVCVVETVAVSPESISRPQETVAVNTEEIFEETITPSLSHPDGPVLIGQADFPPEQIVSENAGAASPASSVASNRKLEWDNGADIGYDNTQIHKSLQKSVSLPILCKIEVQKTNLIPVEKVTKSKRPNSDLDAKSFRPAYSSSTTESSKSVRRVYSSSSSSERQSSRNSSSSNSKSGKSESILSFLQRKVGLPIAESTPVTQADHNSAPQQALGTPRTTKPNSRASSGGKRWSIPKSSSCEDLQPPPSKPEKDPKRSRSQVDLNMVDQVSHYKNLKVLKLSVSKPVTVECYSSTRSRAVGEDKLVQTSLPRNFSIAVQTDFDFTGSRKLQAKRFEQQSVIYMCHNADSDSERNVHSSAGTQTVSDALSNHCNSFEYLSGEEYGHKFVARSDGTSRGETPRDQTPSEANATETVTRGKFPAEEVNAREVTAATHPVLVGNLKRCPPKTNLMSVTSESDTTAPPSQENSGETTSKSSPLAQLLASKQNELENDFALLKKVMRSKKYDKVTKKFYLKKIIQRILDTKISTDDGSSGSHNSLPELCGDKADGKTTGESDSGTTGKSGRSDPPNLQANKPWVPAPQSSGADPPPQRPSRPRTLLMQTFTAEILPEECRKSPPINCKFVPIQVMEGRPRRSPLLTLTDDGSSQPAPPPPGAGGDSNSTANELYETLQVPTSEVTTPVVSSTSSSGRTRDNWRTNKTRSEELFERRAVDGRTSHRHDHVVQFARKEREQQLSWINDEITHLSKLKRMLELKRSAADGKVLHTMVREPRVEEMQGVKRATTVYIVTTEKSSESSRAGELKFSTRENSKCPARYVRPSSTASSSERAGPPPAQSARRLSCVPQSAPRLPKLLGHKENVISVGDERINLDKARLVSSEQFVPEGRSRATTVRRYTFEIAEEQSDAEPVTKSAPASPERDVQKATRTSRSSTPTKGRRLSCELVLTDSVGAGNATPCSPACDKKVCKCTQTESPAHFRQPTSSSSSSTSSSSTAAGASTVNLCRCCKRKYAPEEKPSSGCDSPRYVLCHPCYGHSLQANQTGTRPYYTYPGHVCRCYDGERTQIVHEMKDTIEKLQDLELEEECCKCGQARMRPGSSCCQGCERRLPQKGIAYVLTLEPDERDQRRKHGRRKKRRQRSLPEIKIKVVSPRRGKKSSGRVKVTASERGTTDEESGKENSGGHGRRGRHKKPTLQDYLCVNRPNFVASAEERRQCLIDLAYMREQRCQKYKQLLALTSGIPLQNSSDDSTKPKRVFSPEEMKQITERRYKKLPEVQQKLIDNREKQMRKANKLLTDIFNQKLRQQVLKGKHTMPPNASIIKLA